MRTAIPPPSEEGEVPTPSHPSLSFLGPTPRGPQTLLYHHLQNTGTQTRCYPGPQHLDTHSAPNTAGDTGAQQALTSSPGPTDTHLQLGIVLSNVQNQALPSLSCMMWGESLPLAGPLPDLRSPHLGGPVCIIFSKHLILSDEPSLRPQPSHPVVRTIGLGLPSPLLQRSGGWGITGQQRRLVTHVRGGGSLAE